MERQEALLAPKLYSLYNGLLMRENSSRKKNELGTMRSFSSSKYLSSKIHRHYVLLVSSEEPGNSETSLGCFKMNSIFVCLYFSQDCHQKTK